MAAYQTVLLRSKEHDVVRSYHSDICRVLSRSEDTLILFAGELYAKRIIDVHTKNTVIRKKGYDGADILMDRVEMKVEQTPTQLERVLRAMKELEDLQVIGRKIRSKIARSRRKSAPILGSDQSPGRESSSEALSSVGSSFTAVVGAAETLKKSFEDLLVFVLSVITNVNVPLLKLKLNMYISSEQESTAEVREHLDKLQSVEAPDAVLNFLVNRNFVGYLNYKLLQLFAETVSNFELSSKIQKYKKDHDKFLQSAKFNVLVEVFQEKPELRPVSAIGLPKLTLRLESPWEGRDTYSWKELLDKQFNWPPHVHVTSITRNCIVIEYSVLPFFAPAVVRDLTDPLVLAVLKRQGVTVTLSKELKEVAVQHETLELDTVSNLSVMKQPVLPFEKNMATVSSENYPAVDQFAEELVKEPKWYTLSTFLGVPFHELSAIERSHSSDGIMRCLIEVHAHLHSAGKPLSWEKVADSLSRMNNRYLADFIRDKYIVKARKQQSPVSSIVDLGGQQQDLASRSNESAPENQDGSTSSRKSQEKSKEAIDVPQEVKDDFFCLTQYFSALVTEIVNAFRNSNIPLQEVQKFIEEEYKLRPLSGEEVTFDGVFSRLRQHYSLLGYTVLKSLVQQFLNKKETLLHELATYTNAVNSFKSSAKLAHLMVLVEKQVTTDKHKIVKLEVREFWAQVTLKKFETMVTEILDVLYHLASQISIGKGCKCVSWVLPNIADAIDLVPPHPLEFIQIIGVVSLHIGDSVVYDIPGEGCEVMEAAMLQAIELRNERAVELLLAVGCDLEVAACIGGMHIVDNVINSDSNNAAGTVQHVCIFGQNQNVEEILSISGNDGKMVAEMKDKMYRCSFQEIDTLQKRLKEKEQELMETRDTLKSTEAKVTELEQHVHDATKERESEEQKVMEIGDTLKSTEPRLGTLEQGKEVESEEDERMAELVKTRIITQGCIDLRILKGLLLGGPGVGKTTTILRLLGKLLNLSECGPTASTGIQKPEVVHLCHRLYHDTAEMSLMIQKEWRSLSLDDQLGALLYCISNPLVKEAKGTIATLSEPKHLSHPSKPPPSQAATSERVSSKSPVERLEQNIYMSKFQEIEDLIKRSKWRQAHQMLDSIAQTTILHITDTGGQPEFFEILPLLLRGPSLSLVFLNLTQPLSKLLEVVYCHSDTSTPLVKYVSSYTPMDMVHQVLASIESLNQSTQRSAAFLIATHRDQVKEEMVEAFEREIKASLKNTSFYKSDLLRGFIDHLGKRRLVFAVDNKNGKVEDMLFLRKVLTDSIQYLFKPESLPTSWAFFHLLLRYTFENDGMCSLREAVKIAGCCGVDDEKEVRDVLHFFYVRFGTIFYFGDVPALENLVICDPNLIFHPITRLITESFGANPLEPNTSEEIRKTGEIAWYFFERICQMDEKTKQIDTRKIVELLKHLHVITEIRNGDIRLFMPCLLRPYPLEKLKMSKEELSSMSPAPLLFTFSPTGYQPISLFHVLISRLMSKKFMLREERYRNRVVLYYGDVEVEIISTPLYLEIRMSKAKNCKEVLELLDKEMATIMEELPHMKGINSHFNFHCPCLMHSNDASASTHLAKFERFPPHDILRCSDCEGASTMELEMKHRIWFEDFPVAGSVSLSQKEKSESNGSMVTAGQILQQYYPRLLNAVSNPVKLANDMWAENLIPRAVKEDIVTNTGIPNYNKASMMLSELTKLLNVLNRNQDQANELVKFCRVLKHQEDPALSFLADEMLKCIRKLWKSSESFEMSDKY